MPATLASAGLTCVGALVIGQAALRLCGARRWSWLAPALGVSLMMIVAVPAIHIPGRAATTAVALLVLAVGALAFLVATPSQRPPLAGLLAALPVMLLSLVPFASAGHAGILGVSINNDMAAHLAWAEAYRSELVAQVNTIPSDYPLGPHALAAALAEGLGIGVEQAFTGITLALPALLAWTALGALRNPRAWGPVVTATLVGMPFLVASYYGHGSFKEPLQAMLVLAVAIHLAGPRDLHGRLRWVPLALMLVGVVSVYSVQGLAWPPALIGLWVAGSAAALLYRGGSLGELVARGRREAAPVAVAVAVLAVAIVPQLPRLEKFFASAASTNGTGIATTNLGNVPGSLSVWEAFGVWDNPDYRLPAVDPFATGMWTALVLALAVFGVVWAVRRRELVLPAAAAVAYAVWVVSDRTQSPYVAAKALAILAPLLMIVIVRPLAERVDASWRMPSWWWAAAPALAAVLVVKAVGSSWDALRFSKVGPTAHLRELRELRPLLGGGGRPTLFLGNDDFIGWELAGVRVGVPVVGSESAAMAMRPEKAWQPGQSPDFDSLDSRVLNEFDWVITPRDAAGSSAPEGLRLARTTRNFSLWRRMSEIPPRSLLREREAPAAVLRCRTRRGRAVVRGGGVAGVRGGAAAVAVGGLPPGAETTVVLRLTPGRWDLETPYTSPRPIEVRAPGLRATLAANLDRVGTRWPIGRIAVSRPGPVRVSLRATKGRLSPGSAIAHPVSVVAVPVGTERVVPIASACGKFVDWYRPAAR